MKQYTFFVLIALALIALALTVLPLSMMVLGLLVEIPALVMGLIWMAAALLGSVLPLATLMVTSKSWVDRAIGLLIPVIGYGMFTALVAMLILRSVPERTLMSVSVYTTLLIFAVWMYAVNVLGISTRNHLRIA